MEKMEKLLRMNFVIFLCDTSKVLDLLLDVSILKTRIYGIEKTANYLKSNIKSILSTWPLKRIKDVVEISDCFKISTETKFMIFNEINEKAEVIFLFFRNFYL